MYLHKRLKPQSEYIRYRGNTGQIDVQSTIIVILAKNPGLRGCDIADLIYNKTFMGLSYSYVYRVLRKMSRGPEALVVRSGGLYYLLSDGLSHDMAVTADMVERLGKAGIDLTQARFLSSGLLMFAEQTKAEANGENYDMNETAAVNLASEPEAPEIESSDENEESEEESVELEITENPFESIDEDERQSIKEQVETDFKEEAEREQERIEREKRKKVLSNITTAQSLLGQTVEINPGQGEGQLVGTILELRPTGVTFLITFSTTPGIEEGSVIPYEYAQGLVYKIVVNPEDFE